MAARHAPAPPGRDDHGCYAYGFTTPHNHGSGQRTTFGMSGNWGSPGSAIACLLPAARPRRACQHTRWRTSAVTQRRWPAPQIIATAHVPPGIAEAALPGRLPPPIVRIFCAWVRQIVPPGAGEAVTSSRREQDGEQASGNTGL
jgi:hypothetical protein